MTCVYVKRKKKTLSISVVRTREATSLTFPFVLLMVLLKPKKPKICFVLFFFDPLQRGLSLGSTLLRLPVLMNISSLTPFFPSIYHPSHLKKQARGRGIRTSSGQGTARPGEDTGGKIFRMLNPDWLIYHHEHQRARKVVKWGKKWWIIPQQSSDQHQLWVS